MDPIPAGLIEEYTNTRGCTKQTFYNQVGAVRKELGNSPSKREAAGIVASRANIDFHKYFSDRDEINQIVMFLAQVRVGTAAKAPAPMQTAPAPAAPKLTVLKLKDRDLQDPILPSEVLSEAKKMAEVYVVLYVFENSVRQFIRRVLSSAVGANWWATAVPREVRTKAQDRRNKDDANSWYSSRGGDEICYIDIKDLKRILIKNASSFSPYLDLLPEKAQWLYSRIAEIELLRNTVAHNNPLETDDIRIVEMYFQHWEQQLLAWVPQLSPATP